MIVDTLENAEKYYEMHPHLETAFQFIKDFIVNDRGDGRFDILGDEIYAIVSSYQTKPSVEMNWEIHKKYIDIQYILKGEEIHFYTNGDNLTSKFSYNVEKDIEFCSYEGNSTSVYLDTGFFAIYFPQDGHSPGHLIETPAYGRRVVVKVRCR